jgi:hypothetical protein
VVNYTKQDVNLRFVKIKRTEDGPVKDDKGNYVVSSSSHTMVVPPSANDGNGLTKLAGWGPGTSKGYDGYSAQTADGMYSVTASLSDDFGYDQGEPCYTAYAYLCTNDGTTTQCITSDGVAANGYGGKPMTKDGQYVGRMIFPHMKLMLLLLILVVIVIVGGGGYYYYRHHHMT